MRGAATARVGWVFIGPEGLRAVWGLGLFLAVLRLLSWGVSMFVDPWLPMQDPTGIGSPFEVVLSVWPEALCVLGATWFMARLEGRSMGAYGFGRPRHFLRGCLWGFAGISGLVLALWATGHLRFQGLALGSAGALRNGAVWALAFTGVACVEEGVMRGYLQFTLARGLAYVAGACGLRERKRVVGFAASALFFSFLFGYGHRSNPGESPMGLVMAGGAGLLFCLSLWHTGSLSWALGFHLAWDWGETFFYGTPDSGLAAAGNLLRTSPQGHTLWSGGATGPEGSLLVVPVLLLLAVAAHWTLKPRPAAEAGAVPADGRG